MANPQFVYHMHKLSKALGLRVDEQTEVEGLDARLHGETVP